MSKKTVYMRGTSGEVFSTNFPEYHKECETLTRAEGERIYRDQTAASLRKWIKPGTTIYTKLESVSSSGMSRRISLYAVTPAKKGQPAQIANITGSAAVVMGRTVSDKGGISVGGCGMDMGFSLVYDFGHSLWPKGTRKPHGKRNGEPDSAGGYALKHSWI
ncbi:hypothetical protein D3C85_382350 [compost metagenome]